MWADLRNPYVWTAVAALVGYGFIGFLDDYAKVTKRRNLGLSGRRKLSYQFTLGFVFTAFLLVMRAFGDFSTAMNIPFLKQFQPSLLIPSLLQNPWTYVLGVAPFCIFVALVVVFMSNAVNLTDGLDGLAIGLMVIAAGALTMLTYAGGHAAAGRVPAARAQRAHRRADHLLRLHDRRQPGLPLVQRAPGGNLHGRCRLAGTGRRHGRGGRADQAGNAAALHRRHLRAGGRSR